MTSSPQPPIHARLGAARATRRIMGVGGGGLGVAMRTSNSGLLALSLAVGAAAAGFAVLFRWLIRIFTLLFSGHPDYAAVPGAAHPSLP
ncbi:MAG TPA: hypothetical protein VGN48_01875, partial [Pedococcus sp.]|nr:hypothetical protein [Pedococcus sp.]